MDSVTLVYEDTVQMVTAIKLTGAYLVCVMSFKTMITNIPSSTGNTVLQGSEPNTGVGYRFKLVHLKGHI